MYSVYVYISRECCCIPNIYSCYYYLLKNSLALKGVAPFKMANASCEIKGGGQEMAAMAKIFITTILIASSQLH